MLKQLQPHYVSDIQKFLPLKSSHSSGPCSISKDTNCAWIANGCVLEVYDTRKNERQSFWKFRSDIVAVAEFSGSTGLQLLVGLSISNVLCLYDVQCSKVVKAVKLPYDIKSLDVVACKGGACLETRFLSPLLRYMFGLVAVGTGDGYVLLLDLCLDEDSPSDEHTVGELIFVTKHDEVAVKREATVTQGQHLCYVLNENFFLRGQFIHKFGDRNIQVQPDEAGVTCVKYISTLSMLALGFTFGGVQLWNLQKLALQFSWCPEKVAAPVVKFAFQEPENDPRNYCYLWVVSGQDVTCTTSAEVKSTASLYSLVCGHKDWLEGFGAIYQDLESCTFRFDYTLTANETDREQTVGSRIISCTCVHPAELMTTCKGDEITNDEWLNQDLSLCVLVWEAWQTNLLSSCHMAIFDINQWYQAQMPSNIRGDESSFFALFSLEDVVERLQDDDQIMDVCIYPSSLAKFFSLSSSEEFYYPSSLAFRAFCLSQKGTVRVSYLGIQRQVLWLMEKKGYDCLQEPAELFGLAFHSGLVEPSSSQARQREELLTLAVENHLLAFLAGCIVNLHGQDRVSGISLKFLLEWAWKKVTQIKMSVDKLCETFFNCSGQDLDQRSLSLLYSYLSQLKNLAEIFQLLRSNTGPLTEQGDHEIQIRQEVTELFAMYLKAVLWLHQCSLLPEHAEGDAYGENEVAFPTTTLAEAYNHRRQEIQKLHSTISQTDLLLIDAIVSKMGLANQWEKIAGGGLYPPPSLHAALNSYLLHGILMEDKHCFLLYLLLDLASFLSDKQSHLEEKLVLFPASFHLCPSRVKLTQGFWMLDHKDFQEALVMFLDPIIKPEDILPWQHIRIMKSYLFQGEQKKALKYAQVRKPPLQTPEQVKLHLTLLLANRLTAEAFHYQRQCREQMSMDDMLNHFFIGCQQTSNMDALLQLPFSPTEERALVQFLLNSPEPHSQELLVGYFLQRCRPLEAAQLNTKLRPEIMENPLDRDYTAIRSALLSSYLQTLPSTQNKLDAHIRGLRTKATPQKTETVQPLPLSSCVKSVSLRHTSLSSLLCHLEDKVRQTWMPNSSSYNESWTVENTPLVGTPIFRNTASQKEMDVVLATPVGKRPLIQQSEFAWTPNKKSRLLDYNPLKWSHSDRRRSAPFSDALSLLQTPPIKRRSQPLIRERLPDSVSSILKTKPVVGASTSTLLDSSDGGKSLRFSSSQDMKLSSKGATKSSLSFDVPLSEEIVEDEEITVNYSRVFKQLDKGKKETGLNLDKIPDEDFPKAKKYDFSLPECNKDTTETNKSVTVLQKENIIPLETETRVFSPTKRLSPKRNSPCSVNTEISCASSQESVLSVHDESDLRPGSAVIGDSALVHSEDSCEMIPNGPSVQTDFVHVTTSRISSASEQTETSSSSSTLPEKRQLHIFRADNDGGMLIQPLADVCSDDSSTSSRTSEKIADEHEEHFSEHIAMAQVDVQEISTSVKNRFELCHEPEDENRDEENVFTTGFDFSEPHDLEVQGACSPVQEVAITENESFQFISSKAPISETEAVHTEVASETEQLFEENLPVEETNLVEKNAENIEHVIGDENTSGVICSMSEPLLSNEEVSEADIYSLKQNETLDILRIGHGLEQPRESNDGQIVVSFAETSDTSAYGSIKEGSFVPQVEHASDALPNTAQIDPNVPVELNINEDNLPLPKKKVSSSLKSKVISMSASRTSPRTLRSSLRQSSTSSAHLGVEDSPVSGKSTDDSFVSATSQSLAGSFKDQDSLQTTPPQTDDEMGSGSESTVTERELKSSRYSMRLRSSSPEAATPLTLTRRRRGRPRTLNTSVSSTESESHASVPSTSAMPAKKSLFRKVVPPTTIPEFAEPNYPLIESIPLPETLAATVPVFVFSPPLTRSRVRRKKSQELPSSSDTSVNILPEGEAHSTRSTNKKDPKKSVSSHQDWEDTVILISPMEVVKKGSETSTSRRATSLRRVTRSRSRQIAKL